MAGITDRQVINITQDLGKQEAGIDENLNLTWILTSSTVVALDKVIAVLGPILSVSIKLMAVAEASPSPATAVTRTI